MSISTRQQIIATSHGSLGGMATLDTVGESLREKLAIAELL